MEQRPFRSPQRVSPDLVCVEIRPAKESARAYVDGKVSELSAAELNVRAQDTKRLIEAIVADRSVSSDVARYLWTERIVIDPTARPSSFPLLTLDAEYSASLYDRSSDPVVYQRQVDMLRSLLVHEQLHLWVGPPNPKLNPVLVELIQALKEIEPLRALPIPECLQKLGAQARVAVDLHLVVNWLELQANKRFVGERRARDLLLTIAAYPEIYRAVIEADEDIGRRMGGEPFCHYLVESRETAA